MAAAGGKAVHNAYGWRSAEPRRSPNPLSSLRGTASDGRAIARKGSVLIVTEMDEWSASTRYRALQYQPYLRDWFADVRTSLPGDTVVRRPGPRGRVAYFSTHAVRYAQRAASLKREIDGADALFIQRGLYPTRPRSDRKPSE